MTGKVSLSSWKTRDTKSLGQTTESTSPSPVPTVASAGTAASTTRPSSRKIWRRCSSTAKPQDSVPGHWSLTRAGWVRQQQELFSWGDRWRTVQTFPLCLHRQPGQTASSAGGRPSRSWRWDRSSAVTRIKAGSRQCGNTIRICYAVNNKKIFRKR